MATVARNRLIDAKAAASSINARSITLSLERTKKEHSSLYVLLSSTGREVSLSRGVTIEYLLAPARQSGYGPSHEHHSSIRRRLLAVLDCSFYRSRRCVQRLGLVERTKVRRLDARLQLFFGTKPRLPQLAAFR